MRKQFKSVEENLFSEDYGILDFKATKNELESFLVEMRYNLDNYGPLEKYINPSLREQFLAEINQAYDWLYGEGQTAPKEQFKEKLAAFKKVGLPIKERHRFYSEIEVFLQQFQNFGQEMNERLNTSTLTDQQRGDILAKYTEMQAYFNELQTTIGGKPLYEEPGYQIDDVHMKLDTFKDTVNKLFTAPPPQPEKSAEKKAEGADVEMKPEDKPAEASGEAKQ